MVLPGFHRVDTSQTQGVDRAPKGIGHHGPYRRSVHQPFGLRFNGIHDLTLKISGETGHKGLNGAIDGKMPLQLGPYGLKSDGIAMHNRLKLYDEFPIAQPN